MKFIIILLLLPVLAFAEDDSFESTKVLAEQGHAGAQNNLGAMYYFVIAVRADFPPSLSVAKLNPLQVYPLRCTFSPIPLS